MNATTTDIATPHTPPTTLVEQIDFAFANLQNLSKMGDYVKFDDVSDLILDIRLKAAQLN